MTNASIYTNIYDGWISKQNKNMITHIVKCREKHIGWLSNDVCLRNLSVKCEWEYQYRHECSISQPIFDCHYLTYATFMTCPLTLVDSGAMLFSFQCTLLTPFIFYFAQFFSISRNPVVNNFNWLQLRIGMNQFGSHVNVCLCYRAIRSHSNWQFFNCIQRERINPFGVALAIRDAHIE